MKSESVLSRREIDNHISIIEAVAHTPSRLTLKSIKFSLQTTVIASSEVTKCTYLG